MTSIYAYESHRRYHARFRSKSPDLNALLDLAERLRHNCEIKTVGLERLRLVQTANWGALALLLGGLGVVAQHLSGSRGWWGVLGGSSAIVLFLAHWIWKHSLRFRRQESWFSTEYAALQDVLGLLQDCEARMTEDERWTVVDRARFRVQLTRYAMLNRNPSRAARGRPNPPTIDPSVAAFAAPPAAAAHPQPAWSDPAARAEAAEAVGPVGAAGRRSTPPPRAVGRFVLHR